MRKNKINASHYDEDDICCTGLAQPLATTQESIFEVSNESTLNEGTNTVADHINVSYVVTDDIFNRNFPVQLENEAIGNTIELWKNVSRNKKRKKYYCHL